MDADRDSYYQNFYSHYSNTPFWYQACWNGSINGGGERTTPQFYPNGAFWVGATYQFATTGTASSAQGAGNGWIWIRHK